METLLSSPEKSATSNEAGVRDNSGSERFLAGLFVLAIAGLGVLILGELLGCLWRSLGQ